MMSRNVLFTILSRCILYLPSKLISGTKAVSLNSRLEMCTSEIHLCLFSHRFEAGNKTLNLF